METQSADLHNLLDAVRQSPPAVQPSSMSILDILVVLAKHKWFILVFTFIVTATAATRVHFMRDSFKAQAVILPPQQQQSSLAVLASGALAGLTAAVKTPGDLYVGMLKSHSVSDEIVVRFHLRDVYQRKFESDARTALIKHSSFITGKDSLIVISVEDYDPHRAAALANAFVDGLYQLTSRLALTDASQRRLFFEQELRRDKDNLSDAEVALSNVQRSTGLLLPAGQEGMLIGSTARLRAEISSREVTLHATQLYATNDNPQVQTLQRELAAMRAQLNSLETRGNAESNFEISAGKLPDATLEYIRKVRDLKYYETLYELLAKQYEAARIDESKQAPLIQVIDRASVPDRRSGPARIPITLEFALLGFVLSCVSVCAFDRLQALLADPRHAKSLASIRSSAKP